MDKETLRKVQLAQLSIALEVKRVCDENNINYFLDSGTLIGAIRHKGFIPWDDDLDIGMLRNDYEKFIKIAPEKLSDDYYLQTWETDRTFPLPFAKVRKKGTVYLEEISQKKQDHNELFVDILPYDAMSDDLNDQKRLQRQLFVWCRLLFAKDGLRPWKHHERKMYRLLSFCRYIPFLLIAPILPREIIRKHCIGVMQQYNGKETGLVFEQWGDMAGKKPVPSVCFSEFVETEFEGLLFKVPINYDGVLKAQYGNYMQLPPENERENRHHVLEIKL